MSALLISGGNGLLASELIRQITAAEPTAEIIAVSSDCDKFRARHQGMPHVFCIPWTQLEHFPLEGADAVIHCAFSRTDDFKELSASLQYTERLVEKAGGCASPIPFIGISSRSVYGQSLELPWTEQTPVSPNSAYAFAKVAQELLTAQMAQAKNVPCTNLRLAGLIGPGMEARLLSKLIQQTLKTHSIQVTGGTQLFAMLDIRDAAAGILALLRLPASSWKPVYNLGAEKAYRLDEIAAKLKLYVEKTYSWKLKVNKQEKDILLVDGMDCSSFYQDTNWRPQYSLEDTMQQLFNYYELL